MGLETLAEARKNIRHDEPLHFVRARIDGELIFAYCAARKTRILQNNLLNALKVLGQACVRAHSAGRLSRASALEALITHRRFGVSDRCARTYLAKLTEAGVLRHEAGDMLVMVNFAGDMQPWTQAFFDRRAEHQRAGSARRSAKHRAAAALTDGQKSTSQVAVITAEKDTVTPQSFTPSHAKTKTKDQAGGLTQAALSLPDLSPPVPAPKGKPRSTAAFVRTSAPQKESKHTAAEIDANERAMLGEPAPKPAVNWQLDAIIERCRLLHEAKKRRETEEQEAPQSEQDDSEDAAPKRPVRQGAPPLSPKSKPPRAQGRATMAQLRDLEQMHARHLGGHNVNLLALYNAQMPHDVVRQAFDIAAERLRTCPMGQSKTVHNPGGFILGSMRMLRKMGR